MKNSLYLNLCRLSGYEILNPSALKLIEGMQDLKLIKVSDEPESKLKAYLKKMRKNAVSAPTIDEITEIVEDVRSKKVWQKINPPTSS